jgi:hypothetical protein
MKLEKGQENQKTSLDILIFPLISVFPLLLRYLWSKQPWLILLHFDGIFELGRRIRGFLMVEECTQVIEVGY